MPNNEEEWIHVANDFYTMWNFPHCIGACDGKHVMIKCPNNSVSTFFNYNKFFSIVLMAIADANYCFSYANIGCQGKISDGGVFHQTSFYKMLYENKLSLPTAAPLLGRKAAAPYVFLTDDAFSLQVHIMKPYPGIHEKGSSERIYNYRHCRTRRVVENTFGVLASVFRIFRKPMEISVENAEVITTTCVHLHNFLRKISRPLYSLLEPLTRRILMAP